MTEESELELQGVSPDVLIEAYRELRRRKKELEDEVKATIKPLAARMKNIEAEFTRRLQADGVNSTSTDHGTAYLTHRNSATVKDAAAFKEFIETHGEWGLADIRANAPAIVEFIEEHGSPPPGVNLTRYVTTNIKG